MSELVNPWMNGELSDGIKLALEPRENNLKFWSAASCKGDFNIHLDVFALVPTETSCHSFKTVFLWRYVPKNYMQAHLQVRFPLLPRRKIPVRQL